MRSDGRRADRALSEVLGFALVFALVLSVVAIVSVTGFADLDNTRQFEQTNNAERAFDVVGDNMDDLILREAPSRATEIRLTDATLTVGETVSFNVTAEGHGIPDFGTVYTLRPIVYEGASETKIVYSGGAVLRSQRDGGIVVREPPFVLNASRVHLPMALTQARSTQSIGGSTIRLRTDVAKRDLGGFDNAGRYGNVTINVTSPRYELWNRYFSDQPAVERCEVNATAKLTSCLIDGTGTDNIVQRFSVQTVRINVEFEK